MDEKNGLERIKQWVSTKGASRLLIAVAGGSCAGKTVFSNHIAELFPQKVSVIRMDNYFRDINDPILPHTPIGFPVFDKPGSYHETEFRDAVTQLLSGKIVHIPVYDLENNRKTSFADVLEPAHVLVADGLFTIRLLHGLFFPKICVYMDASSQTRLDRRIKRDSNIPADVVKSVYQEQILPCHSKYIESQRNCADFIINTD